jgi:hypothetical protein
MKKIYLLAGMAALMLASCSTDEQASGGYVAGSTVTLNATLPNSGTRVNEAASDTYGLITTWSADDSLDVLVNTNAIVSMTKGTTANTFTATPANATIGAGFNAGQTIYGVNNKYNDKITTAVNSSKLKATVDFTGQKGTVDNLKRYDLMYGKGDPTSSNITFNHKICVLRLDINSDSLKADGITSITGLKLKYVVSSGTKLFGSQEVYNFGATCDSTITDADSLYLNSTSIAVADGKATVYIAVPHRQNLFGTLYIKLKGSNGTISKVYDLTNAISLSNGRMLMSTVHPQAITGLNRTKVNIGNYLFSDGTWGILADSLGSAKPIAVVFSKTTSTIDQCLSWSHGYAMALKNASTSCAWTALGTIDDNPTGTYITTTAAIIADKDGYTHTQMIEKRYSVGYFPAADAAFRDYFYENKLTATAPSNTSGWYLPSIGQWYDICVNLGKMSATSYTNKTSYFYWEGSIYNAQNCANHINVYLTPLISGSYDTFSRSSSVSYCYWCSSECSSTNALCADFNLNNAMYLENYNTKTTTCSVRPVIAF